MMEALSRTDSVFTAAVLLLCCCCCYPEFHRNTFNISCIPPVTHDEIHFQVHIGKYVHNECMELILYKIINTNYKVLLFNTKIITRHQNQNRLLPTDVTKTLLILQSFVRTHNKTKCNFLCPFIINRCSILSVILLPTHVLLLAEIWYPRQQLHT